LCFENEKSIAAMKKSKVTIYDIARELKVAPSTISRAIAGSGLISDEVREKVRAKAMEMGYNNRNFRVNQADSIAIVVPEINNFFYHKILAGIQQKIDTQLPRVQSFAHTIQ